MNHFEDHWRSFRKLSLYYKVLKSETPCYCWSRSIPSCNRMYETRSNQNDIIPQFPFKYIRMDITIRNSPSSEVFKKRVLSFVRHCGKGLYNASNMKGIIFSTKLRIGQSHLREHKFKYSFLDTPNPILRWDSDIKILRPFYLLGYCFILAKDSWIENKTDNCVVRNSCTLLW